MTLPGRELCCKDACSNSIPQNLAAERLCLDHFLDEAFRRTEESLERCRAGQAIDSKRLEWLLADALTIVNGLDNQPGERTQDQQDRMLELLLILANLHEHVAAGSMRVMRPA